MEHYEIFSTTADVGIRIRGTGYEELYRSAVLGLYQLLFAEEETGILPAEPLSPGQTQHPFVYTGDGPENILVNLLSEILYVLQCRQQVTSGIHFNRAGEKHIDARLLLRPLDRLPGLEIKSVTYHNLQVTNRDGDYAAEIVFDI